MSFRWRAPRSPWRAAGLSLGLLGTAWWWRQRRVNRRLAALTAEIHAQAVRELNARWPRAHLEQVWVPLPQGTLHLVTAGPPAGPPVLLLHGFPECWYTWRHQIPFLAHLGYRVLAPDLRGYNLSFRPTGVASYRLTHLLDDLHTLLDALGHPRVHLVGHDWGGVLAWYFAMHAPERVERLVVLNAPHPAAYERELRRNPRHRRKAWYVLFFQLPWLPEALLGLAPLHTARHLFWRTSLRPEAFTEPDLVRYAAAWAQPGAWTAMLNWYRAALRYPAPPWRIVRAPTLLLWGEQDVALDLALTHDLRRWVPHLWRHTVPHAGHWVHLEDPTEVNAALLAFFGEPTPSPHTAPR